MSELVIRKIADHFARQGGGIMGWVIRDPRIIWWGGWGGVLDPRGSVIHLPHLLVKTAALLDTGFVCQHGTTLLVTSQGAPSDPDVGACACFTNTSKRDGAVPLVLFFHHWPLFPVMVPITVGPSRRGVTGPFFQQGNESRGAVLRADVSIR